MTVVEVEDLARWLAETLNGGVWDDPRWYTPEQRELWRDHARKLIAHLKLEASKC